MKIFMRQTGNVAKWHDNIPGVAHSRSVSPSLHTHTLLALVWVVWVVDVATLRSTFELHLKRHQRVGQMWQLLRSRPIALGAHAWHTWGACLAHSLSLSFSFSMSLANKAAHVIKFNARRSELSQSASHRQTETANTKRDRKNERE